MAFDPLDGSSIVDTNFTVGTIFGVWPGEKLTGITGRDQVRSSFVAESNIQELSLRSRLYFLHPF